VGPVWHRVQPLRDGACNRDEDKDGALGYPKCKTGYTGVGPVCWQDNPLYPKDESPGKTVPVPGVQPSFTWLRRAGDDRRTPSSSAFSVSGRRGGSPSA